MINKSHNNTSARFSPFPDGNGENRIYRNSHGTQKCLPCNRPMSYLNESKHRLLQFAGLEVSAGQIAQHFHIGVAEKLLLAILVL